MKVPSCSSRWTIRPPWSLRSAMDNRFHFRRFDLAHGPVRQVPACTSSSSMAPPSQLNSPDGSSRAGTLSTLDDVERLWLEGAEGAALDLLAELLPDRLSGEDFAKTRHAWPARLERIHPAALDEARSARWTKVAG